MTYNLFKGGYKREHRKEANKKVATKGYFIELMDDRKKSPRGRRMSPNKSPVKVIQTEEQCKSGKRTVGQRQRQEVK